MKLRLDNTINFKLDIDSHEILAILVDAVQIDFQTVLYVSTIDDKNRRSQRVVGLFTTAKFEIADSPLVLIVEHQNFRAMQAQADVGQIHGLLDLSANKLIYENQSIHRWKTVNFHTQSLLS